MQALRRWAGLGVGLLSFVYLIFVINPILMLNALVRIFSASASREITRWSCRSIWGFWVILAEVQNGIEIQVTGDAVPLRENALLLPNHQSMADVMTLLCYSWRCGRVGDVRWFVKDIVKYFPGFGWGMWLGDCVFVKRNWAEDKAGVERQFRKYQRQQLPVFMVSFLEGTRYTEDKGGKARAFAAERGLYSPQHTLIPRTKGFVATVQGLRSSLDAIYDITIGYPREVPTLVNCFEAKVPRVAIHVRRFAIDSLPESEDELRTWAIERFEEKDALMAHFAKEQRFPGTPHGDRVRIRDWFRSERRPRQTIVRLQ